MLNSKIEFILNNKIISISDLDTNTTVLNFLRNEKNLTGTKKDVHQEIVGLVQQ